MKKLKTVKFAVLMLFVCAVLFCMKPVGVQASTMQTINTKRQYKSYDITGDNKKDSIQTKWAFDKYVSVIVNRKTIYKDKTPIEYDPTVRYCRFENGEGKKKPSEMCPGTTVHRLVGEIRYKTNN